MYWILVEREIPKADFETAMKLLFPQLAFLYYDVLNVDNNDWANIFIGDGKQITYSIVEWSKKIRTKLEVYDFPKAYSVERTQYIGHFLSKHFSTKVVTELCANDDDFINEYRSVLIDGGSTTIIDDGDIESDTYEYKMLANYEGQIPVFNDSGCL